MFNCTKCSVESPELKKCLGCHQASYCSRVCQRGDWRQHKNQCKPFKLVEVDGAGMGCVATRRIKRGELIMREEPVLVKNYRGITSYNQKNLSLVDQFHQHSDENKHDILWLLCRDPVEGVQFRDMDTVHQKQVIKTISEELLEDVFQSNAIEMFDGDGGGLYLILPRFNHSCKPNLVWSGEASKEVRALRTVDPGEELCVSYILSYGQQFLTSQERRSTLLDKWRFDCQCCLCSDPEANDEKRLLLKSLHDSVKILISKNSYKAALEASEKLLSELEQSGEEFTAFIPSNMINVYIVSEYGRARGLSVPDYSHYVDQSLKLAKMLGESFVKELKMHLKLNT